MNYFKRLLFVIIFSISQLSFSDTGKDSSLSSIDLNNPKDTNLRPYSCSDYLKDMEIKTMSDLITALSACRPDYFIDMKIQTMDDLLTTLSNLKTVNVGNDVDTTSLVFADGDHEVVLASTVIEKTDNHQIHSVFLDARGADTPDGFIYIGDAGRAESHFIIGGLTPGKTYHVSLSNTTDDLDMYIFREHPLEHAATPHEGDESLKAYSVDGSLNVVVIGFHTQKGSSFHLRIVQDGMHTE